MPVNWGSRLKKRIFLMRPYVGKEELLSIRSVFKSKFLSEGEVTKKFERNLSRYVKARYAIATTSATTALHTALESMYIKKKRVLVSDFTFPATVLVINLAGGIPVLIDVEKDTMNVSREIVEDAADSKTEYVLPVSLFGNPLEKKFYDIKKNGIKIIEDAATNLGTKIGNDYVGSLADITCFSFHPRKIITTGEGGMITTNSKDLSEKCRAFKTFGKVENEFIEHGTNYKLSDILSAIGIEQLKRIEWIIRRRQEMSKIYAELLSKLDFVEIQRKTPNSRHTYQSFVCYFTKQNLRDKIKKKLTSENVETQIGTYALHCLPAFRKCLKKGELKNSEFLYKNSLSLPLHEELTQEDQEFICKVIKNMSS